MIMGGQTKGDSFRARKSNIWTFEAKQKRELTEVRHVATTPCIHFGSEDCGGTQEPHSDALDITMDTVGYDVARIFVYTGSSADIIFLRCIKKTLM